jgi:plastocyanin
MSSVQYNPRLVDVHLGDTIAWTNDDVVPHTATARDRSFDSGSVDVGSSWRWTAEKKGSFPYVCTFHPTMEGVITVK